VPRTYSTRVAALAIAVQPKWLDNLLSHFALPGIESGGQGVERRISDDGLLAIEVTRVLADELGMALGIAAVFARALVGQASRDIARVTTASGASVTVSLQDVEQRLRRQLADALESSPRIKRGRPRRTPTQKKTPSDGSLGA